MNTSDAFFRSVEFAELTLRVTDIARVGAFYESELGFHRIRDDAREARFSPTGAEPALIVLEHAAAATARPRGTAGLFHVAFLYPNRAALAVARKLLKRSHHTLRELGQEALAPA